MARGWGFRRSTALHSSAVVGSSAKSQPGEGAAFLVYIPVVEGEVVEMAVQTNGEVPSGTVGLRCFVGLIWFAGSGYL